jgi:hypothetical protein
MRYTHLNVVWFLCFASLVFGAIFFGPLNVDCMTLMALVFGMHLSSIYMRVCILALYLCLKM